MTLTRKGWRPGAHSTIKPSRRAPRRTDDPVTEVVWLAVVRRDGGCLLRDHPCGGRVHWHHRQQVQHGGPSNPTNGVSLCRLHHSRVHNVTPETEGRGLLLTRYDNPADVPVVLPDGRTVLLDAVGGYVETTTPREG